MVATAEQRARAQELLGLAPGATDAEIEAAYRARSPALKRRLVAATTVAEKEAARRALLEVVRARDVLLNRTPLEDRVRGATVDPAPLLERLDRLPRRIRRADALAALDLPADAGLVHVRAVFSAGYRSLTRAVAQTRDEPALRKYAEARRRMRLLERLLFAAPVEVREAAPPPRLDVAQIATALEESRFDVSDLVKGLDESGFDVAEVVKKLSESGLDVSDLVELERSRLDLSDVVIEERAEG